MFGQIDAISITYIYNNKYIISIYNIYKCNKYNKYIFLYKIKMPDFSFTTFPSN